MADDNNIFNVGGGWNRRSGGDRDFDRRPGGSAESYQYARRFDPRSEQEFTNLQETPNQIEARRLEAEMGAQSEEARRALLSAQQNVHFFPSVGKFIIPEENTWAAHLELVHDDKSNLFFNPEKYVFFDKIIAEKFKNPALTDPTHRDYAKYEGLRTNLEVLRNDIIGMYLNDGGFDPGDEKYVPLITGIASALGDALANDAWLKRPFTRSLSVDVANVEGVGAREMYRHLLDMQDHPGFFQQIRSALRQTFGVPKRTWGLPELEFTPFSEAALSAPAPRRRYYNASELAQACAELQQQPGADPQATAGEKLAAASEGLIVSAQRLRSVDTLEPPAREASVEEARNILRWLKNLQFGDKDMEEWLSQGTPAEQLSKTEALSRLVDIYAGQLYQAHKIHPAIADELMVMAANDAAGTLAQAAAEHSEKQMPLAHPKRHVLLSLLSLMPASWEMRQTQSVEQLLDTMASGIERVSGERMYALSPTDRLLNMANHIEITARSLRSIDTLKPPARSESIELAREILRKLKNLGFSDRDMNGALDTGRPEDKAVFAQAIGEMVDVYANLLSEAAQFNPGILNDPRVKQANDAVGSFAHSIKLMAAKELLGSVAAAQQISADITQMPDEWKKLQDRTVGRLVKSMEGGLEQAVGDLMSQQQEQQAQDEELAQQSADAAILHSDYSQRKRRRKRKSAGGPSLTKSAKRRNAADLNGDGVLDKFQGLNLKGDDMIAVRQLGGNLRALNDEAHSLSTPMDVKATESIAPDDKTFSLREREDQQKPPRGNNRPRA